MDQYERIQTINESGYESATRLIYQWVKTNVITYQEFAELLDYVDFE